VNDGVDIILDKWELKEGQDIFAFMESNVKESNVDKVLIVCDKGYSDKANNRTGGVGTETQIITPEIYANVRQEKFIPVLRERDEPGNPILPTYLRARKYIDFSSPERFEEAYEVLLRNLWGRPELRKPQLGAPPPYLFEDKQSVMLLVGYVSKVKDAANRRPERVATLSRDFFNHIIDHIEAFRIDEFVGGTQHDDVLYSCVVDLKEVRDVYVSFLETLCQASQFHIDVIIEFFEALYPFTQPQKGQSTWYKYQFDHFSFFLQELWLYTIMVLMRHAHYDAVGELSNATLFLQDGRGGLETGDFTSFYDYLEGFEGIRKSRVNSRLYSMTAQMLIDRLPIKGYERKDLIEADLLSYYVPFFNGKQGSWFPRCYVYNKGQIQLFQRLKSRRHCVRLAPLFGSRDIEGIKEKIKGCPDMHPGYRGAIHNIPNIKQAIPPEHIGILP